MAPGWPPPPCSAPARWPAGSSFGIDQLIICSGHPAVRPDPIDEQSAAVARGRVQLSDSEKRQRQADDVRPIGIDPGVDRHRSGNDPMVSDRSPIRYAIRADATSHLSARRNMRMSVGRAYRQSRALEINFKSLPNNLTRCAVSVSRGRLGAKTTIGRPASGLKSNAITLFG